MAENRDSLWLQDSPDTGYPSLWGKIKSDVAVVGAGITGLTTAFLLKTAGCKVAVVEANRICSGTTGYTTAKITSLHQLIYARLSKVFDEETAWIFGEANQSAIDQIEDIVEDLEIDCDFKRLPAYTFTSLPEMMAKIESEVQAARKANLPAHFVEETELPFGVEGAIRFDDQARFNPAKYCKALAEAINGDESYVFETSRVVDVKRGTVQTAEGEVEADRVVLATQLPFLDRGAFFISNYPHRSYLLAARIEGPVPKGMYISAETPVRSLAPADGGQILLIGGESHKTGQDPDTTQRYDALKQWANGRFRVRTIDFEWSAQDYTPADGLPYIGYLHPLTNRVLVATGFAKWGMTRGTFAGMILRDLILGKKNPWSRIFSANRLHPKRSAPVFFPENFNAAKRFLQDRLSAYVFSREAPLRRGEGKIVKKDGKRMAAYHDQDGSMHAVSPACTHLGCYVSWNTAEKSWDCPCHGSRFDVNGQILHGPATKALSNLKISDK